MTAQIHYLPLPNRHQTAAGAHGFLPPEAAEVDAHASLDGLVITFRGRPVATRLSCAEAAALLPRVREAARALIGGA